MQAEICHVVHLIYSLTTGGMENVVVQLINHLPRKSFRHTVVALTEIEPGFARRVDGASVELVALKKPSGQPLALYIEVYRLLKRLQPDVVHSCNMAALEFQPIAALARVPLRVHVEHGMGIEELRGKAPRYRLLRKLYRPFISKYVAVSVREAGLFKDIGVSEERVHLIFNGVDMRRFRPREMHDPLPLNYPFQPGANWVVGTVGRQVDIKNPLLLVEAFISLVRSAEPGTERARLAMVGQGPLNSRIAERMKEAGLQDRLWLPGVRDDVPDILRAWDCFALPSLSEATSCALQEAMATGLPIVATDVGGNADVLEQGHCGSLVPSGDVQAFASQLLSQLRAGKPNAQAARGLASVRQRYDLSQTIDSYCDLFLGVSKQQAECA